MNKLLGVVLLAACELQPAPKKKQEAPPPTPADTAAKPVEPPPPAAVGSGSAARPEISAPCMEVGVKVAQVFIDSATDQAQKGIYEQERANMTRKTGAACTAQGWSDEARNCYLATKTPAEIKACETKFSPPPPPKPAPPPEPT